MAATSTFHAAHVVKPHRPTIAYLTKRFPRLSETFILDEILGLERSGIPLHVFALADPGEGVVQPDSARLRRPVTYLRAQGGARAHTAHMCGTLAAHAHLIVRRPVRYVRVVGYVLLKRHHLSTLRHLVEAGRLADALEAENAAHLHAAFAHGPASVAHLVHLLTGLPFSFAAHAKDLYVSAPDLLARKVAASKFVLVCSESAAATLRSIAGPAASKVILAPHGVDTSRFHPATPAPGVPRADSLVVLAVGRLTEKKGFPVLLQALAALQASGREVTCRIVGSGALRGDLCIQATQLGVGDSVEFLGALTQPEVAVEHRAADIFVQPSVVLADGDRDGIPNALLEAMASGVSVVATAVGGIPEVICDGITGLTVPPSDPAALACALGRLYDDPGLCRRLGTAGRAYAVEHLDRTRLLTKIVPLFTPTSTPAPK
jgi:glycosyltransferase involved in cell wall biosynthesis